MPAFQTSKDRRMENCTSTTRANSDVRACSVSRWPSANGSSQNSFTARSVAGMSGRDYVKLFACSACGFVFGIAAEKARGIYRAELTAIDACKVKNPLVRLPLVHAENVYLFANSLYIHTESVHRSTDLALLCFSLRTICDPATDAVPAKHNVEGIPCSCCIL